MATMGTNSIVINEWNGPETPLIPVLTAFVAKPLLGCAWFTDWPLKLAGAQLGHLQAYMHHVGDRNGERHISTWGIYKVKS